MALANGSRTICSLNHLLCVCGNNTTEHITHCIPANGYGQRVIHHPPVDRVILVDRAKAVLLVLALSLIKNNIRLGHRSIQRCNLLNVTWLHCLAVPTNL